MLTAFPNKQLFSQCLPLPIKLDFPDWIKIINCFWEAKSILYISNSSFLNRTLKIDHQTICQEREFTFKFLMIRLVPLCEASLHVLTHKYHNLENEIDIYRTKMSTSCYLWKKLGLQATLASLLISSLWAQVNQRQNSLFFASTFKWHVIWSLPLKDSL